MIYNYYPDIWTVTNNFFSWRTETLFKRVFQISAEQISLCVNCSKHNDGVWTVVHCDTRPLEGAIESAELSHGAWTEEEPHWLIRVKTAQFKPSFRAQITTRLTFLSITWCHRRRTMSDNVSTLIISLQCDWSMMWPRQSRATSSVISVH